MRDLLGDSRLILGLGRLHHLQSPKQREGFLEEALRGGFRDFDVAPAYGNGLAERTLGNVTARLGVEVAVNTKYGIPVPQYASWTDGVFALRRLVDALSGSSRRAYGLRRFDEAALRSSLAESLARLKHTKAETLFLHEPLQELSASVWEPVCKAMGELVDRGLVKSWGVAGSAATVTWDRHLPPEAVAQIPCSEWLQEPSRWTGRKLILYGVHSALRGREGEAPFADWVHELARETPHARFVVATTRLDRLRDWLANSKLRRRRST